MKKLNLSIDMGTGCHGRLRRFLVPMARRTGVNAGLYEHGHDYMPMAPAIYLLFIAALSMLSGCRKEDMAEQPKYDPHQPTAFFDDGSSARPMVEGAVSRGGAPADAYEYRRTPFSTTAPSAAQEANLAGADFPADFPRSGEPLRRTLERGAERFGIYCSVCHGRTGAGDGMIVLRGFTRPPAYYPLATDAKNNPDLYRREQNLLTVPPGYFYDKITNGYGAMYSYASRVAPADRWAIAAYIKVLQLSQYANIADLPDADRVKIQPSKGVTQP